MQTVNFNDFKYTLEMEATFYAWLAPANRAKYDSGERDMTHLRGVFVDGAIHAFRKNLNLIPVEG